MMTLGQEAAAPRSYREKVAWINLMTTLVLYVPFFVVAWRWLTVLGPEATLGGIVTLHLMLLPVVILQVILIPLGLAAFWRTGQRAGHEQADERDRTIDARAGRAAYATLLVLAGVGFYTLLPFMLSGTSNVQFSPAPLLLLGFMAFVVAEVVRFGVQALGYRRGF